MRFFLFEDKVNATKGGPLELLKEASTLGKKHLWRCRYCGTEFERTFAHVHDKKLVSCPNKACSNSKGAKLRARFTLSLDQKQQRLAELTDKIELVSGEGNQYALS